MANPRVHQNAAELGIGIKTVLMTLREMGEFVQSAGSAIPPPPVARKLKAKIIEGTYRPSKYFFLSLGQRQDRELLDLYAELPYSGGPFIKLLVAETSRSRETSAELSRAANGHAFFVVLKEDAEPLSLPALKSASLAPEHLLAENGLLVVEHSDGNTTSFQFVGWRYLGNSITLTSFGPSYKERVRSPS